jgi:hypothetical protein
MKNFLLHEAVRMKPIRRFFLTKEQNSPHGYSDRHPTDTPVNDPPTPKKKNFLGCCWNHCTTMALMSSSDLNIPELEHSRGLNKWKTHGDRPTLYRGWSNAFRHMECSISWTAHST